MKGVEATPHEELQRLVTRSPEPIVPPQEAEELSEFGEGIWADGVEDLDAGRKHTLEEVKREFDL